MKALRIAFPAVLLCAMLGARADIIVFKNGDELDGNVLEKTDAAVKLEVEYGTLLIPMERVLRIDKETPEQAAARKKKKDKADADAAENKAEGKVLYKGEWVDKDIMKEDKKKVADEKKAKKDADDAKKKSDELAAQAAKLAAQAQQLTNTANNVGNARSNRFNSNHNSMSSYGTNGNNGSYGGSSYGGSSNNGYNTNRGY
jgi:hypothetical protein